jgi:MFS family permease
MCAMNMQMMANGWFAYHLTGSPAILGATLLASAVPQTSLSFVGGVVSDRVPRRLLMMAVFTTNALLSLWIALFAQMGIITWHHLVIRAFFFGCTMPFLMPSRQGIIGELVGRERLMSAISVNQSLQNIMQFTGPAIAGFLIAWVSIHGAYYVIGGCFIMAALAMVPVKYQRRQMPRKAGVAAFFGDIRDGLRYIGGNRNVFLVLLMTLVAVSFAMPYNSLLPAFGTDILKIGPDKLGILTSLGGAGALMGSLSIAFIGARHRGQMIIGAAFLTGVGLIAFCISESFALSSVIVLAVGAGQAMRMTLSSALLQTYTEDAYIGRVLSVQMMEMGLISLSGFFVALYAEAVGVRNALLTTSVLLVLTAAAFHVLSPRMRRLQ